MALLYFRIDFRLYKLTFNRSESFPRHGSNDTELILSIRIELNRSGLELWANGLIRIGIMGERIDPDWNDGLTD